MAKVRLLAINLSRQSYEYRDVNLELLGGRGLAGEYYHSLSDKNAIVIAPSKFSQSLRNSGGRYSIGYNAPLYNRYRCSTIRGRFGGVAQGLGLDLISIQGELEESGTALISSGQVRFLSDIGTEEKDIFFIKTGRSGNNFSPVATVCDETVRQFGTGGLGAVFGGKKLKKLGILSSGEPSLTALPSGISCARCEKKTFCEKLKAASAADKFFVDNGVFKTLAEHLGIRETLALESLGEQLAQQNGIHSEYLKGYATTAAQQRKDSSEMLLADCLGVCGFALASYSLKPEEKELVSKVRLIEQGLL